MSLDIAADARNVFELLERPALAAPDAEALVFLPSIEPAAAPVRITRAELIAAIAGAAGAFRTLGVGPRDVVSLLAPNLLEVQYAFWGAESAGVVNPVNFLLGPDHIAEILKAAGSTVLVTLSPDVAPHIWEKAVAVRERTPGLRALLTIGGKAPDGALAFEDLRRGADGAASWASEKTAGDLAAFFHTGGTTGAPKLVAHTQGAQVHAARATAQNYGLTGADTAMCGLPMFHVAGPILLSLAALSAGARVVMPTAAGNRDPGLLRSYWRVADAWDATLVGGVPTTLADILAQSGEVGAGRSDRVCMTGGAQLSAGLQAQFEAQTAIPIHQIYGMTETAGVICAAPRGLRPPPLSVGKAVAGVEVQVRGADGVACAPGAPGGVFVRGPNVSPGYYDVAAGMTPLCDEGGWLETGDLGYLDAAGWLYVTGRSKDVIIRSGHNIDPAAIEEVARSHPDVADAVAVGRPDLRAGEIPVVFAVLRTGGDVDAETLKAHIVANVSEAPAKPSEVILLDALPTTAVGKIYRPALKAEAVRRFVAETGREMFGAQNAPPVVVDETCQHAVRLLIGPVAATPEAHARFAAWLAQHTFEHAFVG